MRHKTECSIKPIFLNFRLVGGAGQVKLTKDGRVVDSREENSDDAPYEDEYESDYEDDE